MKNSSIKKSHTKSNCNKFFIIIFSGILLIIFAYFIFFASYQGKISPFTIYDTKDTINISENLGNINELSVVGRTYKDYSGLIVSTEPQVLCKYKNDRVNDGYKTCVAIIEVINTNEEYIRLDNPNIKVDFDVENIRDPKARYSKSFHIVEKKIDNIILNITSSIVENKDIHERFISESERFISENENFKDNKVLKKAVILKNNSIKHNEIKFYKRIYNDFIDIGKLEESESLSLQVYNDTLIEQNISLNDSSINQSKNNIIENFSTENSNEIITENKSILNETENKSILNETENETDLNVIIEEESLKKQNESSYQIDLNITEDQQIVSAVTGNIISLNENVIDNESNNSFLIKNNEPFAIKLEFEIPEYESGSINFVIEGDENKYSIMSDISVCGTLDNENSIYTLNEDINASGTCMTIDAKNVTLNCNGHTITLSGTEGYNTAVDSRHIETTIKNCRFVQTAPDYLSNMINIAYSSNSRIENNTFNLFASNSAGIYLENSENIIINTNEINLFEANSYGIYFSALYNSNISNNNISSISGYTTGIYLDSYSSFINVNNNKFRGYDNFVEGIYFENSLKNISNNTIIINGSSAFGISSNYAANSYINKNNISIIGSNGYHIYLFNTNNTSITENIISILGPSSDGIFLDLSIGNNISSNTIYSLGEGDTGIYINEDSNNNSFSFNNITAEIGEFIYGIYLNYGSDNNFSNDNIYTNCNHCHGLIIDGSNNNKFKYTNIDLEGVYSKGIYFSGSTEYNNFSGIYINTSGDDSSCVYIDSGNHFFNFFNSVFNSSIFEKDIYFDVTEGVWNFTNVSFSSIDYCSETNGTLNIFYYLNLHAKFSNNSNAANINISIFNSSNDLIYSNLTGIDGKIEEKNLLSYKQDNFSEIKYPSNYTIYLNDSGQIINTSFIFDSNKNIELILNSSSNQNNIEILSGGGGGSKIQSNCQFNCSSWSDCISGKQTRECKIINNSNCIEKMPDIKRNCKIEVNNSKNNSKTILFDIYLNPLNEELTLNDNLSVSVGLLNIGIPGTVNATVDYSIYDINNSLIYFETETVPVKTQIEFIKEFPHINFSLGNYKLRADLSYFSQTEPASSEYKFKVVNFSLKNIFRGYAMLILIITIISICILLVVIKIIKYYKKPNSK